MELDGSVALVTGGGVRVGRALALALAEHGADVIVHYHSSAGPADEVVKRVGALGREALAVQADLSRSGQVSRLVEQAVARFGRLDVLVNSAATFEAATLEETTEALWDRHFALNLKAPFFLSQAFAAQMGKDRRGHVVNIADWRGVRPDVSHLAYSLTKSGILAMTRALALALAPDVQVNAIAPGAILPPPGEGPDYLDQLAESIPLRRSGSPVEIVRALLYLLESDFVTGETVFVTGGEHLT